MGPASRLALFGISQGRGKLHRSHGGTAAVSSQALGGSHRHERWWGHGPNIKHNQLGTIFSHPRQRAPTFLPHEKMILLPMILPNLPSKPLGGKNETAECSTSSGQEMQGLTKIEIQTNLSNMHTITSRDLAHRPGEIRKLLAAGETLQWTSHGVPVALIQPASPSAPDKKPDWMARARSAGAVNLSKSPLADSIYADRG